MPEGIGGDQESRNAVKHPRMHKMEPTEQNDLLLNFIRYY
jgi:hypothetical protein